MHPFSLKKEQEQLVTGGLRKGIIDITLAEGETGGPIYVTMAIPEDGHDPLPPFELM
ncbi:hypothetical protein L1285_19160 [Pseudoalteromonas sp. DL2-H2.2]|uniref:hypothetical protein n=1 Tax=Pseudoalteromonas sp. DL2-H2.2 TaxID=2908889 RepID=UPI001F24E3A1|nr:hypothetical protein [Pseudoalteromonas sp. DL2-H2.2]MCF2910435.1 hypothetical protein [Pseudoalteromonas sp. DL2-H2.2]